MSQHDFNIANQGFPATRADLNNALQALASNSSGDAEPSTTFANQWWYETDTNTLKLRNEANNAWLSFATVDQSTAAWTLAHDVDITGTLLVTGVLTANGGAVFNESGADVDFRVESDTDANALFVEGSSGNVGIGTTSPDVFSRGDSKTLGIQGATTASLGVNAASGSTASIYVGQNGVRAGQISGASGSMTINAGSSNYLSLGTDFTERMRITSTGNLGIGTSSPTGILNVKGTGGDAMPATSGSTQSAGLIARLQQGGGIGSVMDIGGNGGGGSWIQVTEPGDLATNYKLLLNPNGGNVGIGTTSPAYPLTLGNNKQFGSLNTGGAAVTLALLNNSNNLIFGDDSANTGSLTVQSRAETKFVTNGSERMRIDSGGGVRINNTANATFSAQLNIQSTSSNNCQLYLKVTDTSVTRSMIIFGNTTNNSVGDITTNGSSTAYNTSSDYRLKTDAQPMVGASDRVLALKPVNFEWISTGTRVDGFLAHEAQAVVPECVTGTKDAMRDEEYEITAAVEATYDEDGNELTAAVEAVMGTRSVPDYQGIDQSKLVPLLTAALQEALTEISALKVRVAALEA
jgi:hypothetical protein